MLKITAEEVNFVLYQYLHESGFQHSAFVFAQEANMHENKYNHYRIPAGLLITFLEKALTLINMETHLNDNEEMKVCQQPFTLLSPHYCDVNVAGKELMKSEIDRLLDMESQMTQKLDVRLTNSTPISGGDIVMRNNGQSANEYNQYDRQNESSKRNTSFTFDTLESNSKSTLILNHHQGQVKVLFCIIFRFIILNGIHQREFQCQGAKVKMHICGTFQVKVWTVSSSFKVSRIAKTFQLVYKAAGDKLVTSASDGYARVWSEKGEIKSIFNCNNISKAQNSSYYKDNDAYTEAAALEQFGSQTAKDENVYMNTMVMVSKWNKDGTLIASGVQDKKVIVWMPQGPSQDHIVKTFNQDNDAVDLDWQNSTDLASCSLDQNIYLWSLTQDQQPLRVWRGHQGTLNAIKWDPAGSLLASCSEDETTYLWSPKQNEAVKALKGHQSSVNNIKWSNHPFPNNAPGNASISLSGTHPVPILATAGRDQTIKLWDVEQGKCMMTLTGHESAVLSLAFSPDNKLLVSGGIQDELIIWSLQDQRIIKGYRQTPQMQGGMVLDANWSHDGMMLAAGNNKSIMLLDIRYLSTMQL